MVPPLARFAVESGRAILARWAGAKSYIMSGAERNHLYWASGGEGGNDLVVSCAEPLTNSIIYYIIVIMIVRKNTEVFSFSFIIKN